MSQKYYFKFERRQVDHLEMDILLEAFNAQQISRHALRQFSGALKIDFGGYLPADPHPILIPELRRFLRVLARRWGAASVPFFCEIEPRFLPLYYTAQLDHLTVFRRPNRDEFIVYHWPDELATLERSAHAGMAQLGRRAGMAPSATKQRQNALSQLFAKLFCHAINSNESPAEGQFPTR